MATFVISVHIGLVHILYRRPIRIDWATLCGCCGRYHAHRLHFIGPFPDTQFSLGRPRNLEQLSFQISRGYEIESSGHFSYRRNGISFWPSRLALHRWCGSPAIRHSALAPASRSLVVSNVSASTCSRTRHNEVGAAGSLPRHLTFPRKFCGTHFHEAGSTPEPYRPQ